MTCRVGWGNGRVPLEREGTFRSWISTVSLTHNPSDVVHPKQTSSFEPVFHFRTKYKTKLLQKCLSPRFSLVRCVSSHVFAGLDRRNDNKRAVEVVFEVPQADHCIDLITLPCVSNCQLSQIFDSRGNPTVEVDLHTEKGQFHFKSSSDITLASWVRHLELELTVSCCVIAAVSFGVS